MKTTVKTCIKCEQAIEAGDAVTISAFNAETTRLKPYHTACFINDGTDAIVRLEDIRDQIDATARLRLFATILLITVLTAVFCAYPGWLMGLGVIAATICHASQLASIAFFRHLAR